MVRRRGGGTGQGQGQGQGQSQGRSSDHEQRGKRQATTPVGGVYKDSRRNIQGDEDFDDDEDEQWTQVNRSKQKSPTNQSGSGSGTNHLNQPDTASVTNNQSAGMTYAGATMGASNNQANTESSSTNEQPRTRPKKFKTPAPEGSMRDDITVEVHTVNGNKFKGSLNFQEAKDGIYKDKLGLDIKLLHGVRFGFSTYPVVKFKLKEQINVDALAHCEFFELLRPYSFKGETRNDVLGCKIRGIRTETNESMQPDADPNVRWVKIEWVDYGLDENQILEWMDLFGERAGELSEDIHPNSDSDEDIFCTGTYSIKMRLNRDIPQLLPMWGKRIRVYHRGVQKLCNNCYGPHPRRNCKSAKVPWTQYVLKFMEKNPEIPSHLYGRWWKIINEEYGEIVEEDETVQLSRNESSNAPSTDVIVLENQHSAETQESVALQTTSKSKKATGSKLYQLTREEEDNLSGFLGMGMSLNEARNHFQKEIEVAEMRQKMRENARMNERGSVEALQRTHFGPTSSTRGTGRGGLSFN